MSHRHSDEPDLDDLTIRPSVRRIAALEAGVEYPTVLEPFSGLLDTGTSAAEPPTSPGPPGGSPGASGGSLPELSYLTLRPLVVRELRERTVERDRRPDDAAAERAPASPDSGGGDSLDGPDRLTVRELVRRRGDDPSESGSDASGSPGPDPRSPPGGPDRTPGASRDADPDPAAPPGPEDLARPDRSGSPGDGSAGSSSLGEAGRRSSSDPPDPGAPSDPTGPTPADSFGDPTERPDAASGDAGPDLSLRAPTVATAPDDARAGPARSSAPTRSGGSAGQDRSDASPLWSDPPRTVVLDRGRPTAGDADGRDAAPSREPVASGSEPSRPGATTPPSGPDSQDSSLDLAEAGLEEQVASSVATMDGEPFERFVDRLSSELERQERIERERRGL